MARRDTKPLAKAPLHELGGVAGLLTADAEAIRRMSGMGDTSVAALKIVHAATIRMLRAEVAAWRITPKVRARDTSACACSSTRVSSHTMSPVP